MHLKDTQECEGGGEEEEEEYLLDEIWSGEKAESAPERVVDISS